MIGQIVMMKIIISLIILFSSYSISFAYILTDKDEKLLSQVEIILEEKFNKDIDYFNKIFSRVEALLPKLTEDNRKSELIKRLYKMMQNISYEENVNDDNKSDYLLDTYSFIDIENSIYSIHSYEKNLNTSDMNFSHVHQAYGTAFYVGNNTVITPLSNLGYYGYTEDGYKGLYILCKQIIDNDTYGEKCVGTAKLKFYDKSIGLAALEFDDSQLENVESSQIVDYSDDSGYIMYGVDNGYEDEITPIGNIFKQHVDIVYNDDIQKFIAYGTLNFHSSPVFLSDSFFGFSVWNEIIEKDEVISFLGKFGNIVEYNYSDNNDYDLFLKELDFHIERSESYKGTITKNYLSLIFPERTDYYTQYDVFNFGKYTYDDNIDGVFLMYYDYSDDSASVRGKFPDETQDLQTYGRIKQLDLNGPKLTIYGKDLAEDSSEEQVYIDMRLYIKIGDTYYGDSDRGGTRSIHREKFRL
ncbi:hypothetical protein N9J72_01215 [Candidatus Gracilibacteria bacterium]|nr:hypothetical protein [Candidatus Gracilibacteria bacterium]